MLQKAWEAVTKAAASLVPLGDMALAGGCGSLAVASKALPSSNPKEQAAVDEDLELINRFKAGDMAAFELLVRKYQQTVHNLIHRFMGQTTEVDDIAQEVFLRVYRFAGSFEGQSRFFTWLYRITLNVCLKARERTNRPDRRAVSLDGRRDEDERPRDVVDPAGSAEDHVTNREMAEIVRQAIMALPEEQRTVVILYRYQNLSYEEMADVLKLSLPAVKSRLHRAKLALKNSLQPYV